MDLNQIKHNFDLGCFKIDDIQLLIETVEAQQEEIYWSDIAIEAMYKSRDEWIKSHKELENTIEQYQMQETLLLERLKKLTLQYKEVKAMTRFIFVEKVMEENLALAQELALIKGEMSG